MVLWSDRTAMLIALRPNQHLLRSEVFGLHSAKQRDST